MEAACIMMIWFYIVYCHHNYNHLHPLPSGSPSLLPFMVTEFFFSLPFILFASPMPLNAASFLAFEPVGRLRGGEHYARTSPPRRAARASWALSCRRGWWWARVPPAVLAASLRGLGILRLRVRPQFATEQKRGIWLAIPCQAQESLGAIWPVQQ